jgi:putative ABC transport system permease protein
MGIGDDVGYALRSLRRRPSFTVFAAATIGLGIGATTAVFSTLETVVINPLPYENGDRMVSLFQRVGSSDAFVPPSEGTVRSWRGLTDVLESVEVWSLRGVTLTGRGEADEIMAGLIRPSIHGLLGREPRIGRRFTGDEIAGEGAPVALISHSMWDRTFGRDPGVLGETLQLDGSAYSIVGVMPRRTLMPGFGLMRADVWLPLDEVSARAGLFSTGVLREGVTIEDLNARLAAVPLATSDGPAPEGWVGFGRLVASDVSEGMRETLGLLMGAVVLLLLVACVNVAHLLLFRANVRRHETAVRSALGAGRGRLVRQLLVESLVLALIGGGFGVLLALVGQDLILRLRPSSLEVLEYVGLNGWVMAFALVVSIVTGVGFGLIPALHLNSRDALHSLRSGSRSAGDPVQGRTQWLLVAGEVALSFALLIGALSVFDNLSTRQRSDVGFRAQELAVMRVRLPAWKYETTEARSQAFGELKDRALGLPGVVHVSVASGVPPHTSVRLGTFAPEGGEPLEGTQMLYGPAVDQDYFATMGQRVVAGRAFGPSDFLTSEDVIVLGEGAARTLFPGGDAIGKRFRSGPEAEWTTVIGVAEDVAMTGLATTERALQAYSPRRQASNQGTVLVRMPTRAEPSSLLPHLRELARSIDPDIRIDRLAVATELLMDTLERERFTTTILMAFAALALLLAWVGLYGVVSRVVGQRTQEIGVRIALGAPKGAIATAVFAQAGRAALAGVAVGLVLSVGLRRVLISEFVGFESVSIAHYSAAALMLFLTTLFAALPPVARATRIDPVNAMRSD